MVQEKSFFRSVCALAVPVAMQSMLQASFSIVDQIMIGQLGTVSIAGVGLAGKFSGIYSVLVSAIGAVAGIMISQYLGAKNKKEVRRSFTMNLSFCICLAVLFTLLCLIFPQQIMGLYSKDEPTVLAAAGYLSIVAWTFLPIAGATLLSTLFRCVERPSLPLIASITAACLNTGLNYILIFGKFGTPAMGAEGAALATLVSQIANFLIMLVMFPKHRHCLAKGTDTEPRSRFNWHQYGTILLPILICEFAWSLGENVYAMIYGHLGTDSAAAMTLITPIVQLMIGALSGLSAAAGIIIGKLLGKQEYDEAYTAAKKLILYGFIGSLIFCTAIVLTRGFYVQIYRVEPGVRDLACQILLAFAAVAPFKVLNMIVGGGILRSGGRTEYVMYIDLMGTWLFGVPLGLLSAFVLELTIPRVYFILSLEECIRFAISMAVLRRKKWMRSLS